MNCRNSSVRRVAVCVPVVAALLLAACEPPTAPETAEPAGPVAGNVTESRVLAEADSGDHWLVNGGRFSGEHFSPQARISEENVGELGLAWATDIPSPIGLSAEPLVIDGVVYLTGIRSVVYALDAASGALLWQFDPRVRLDMGFGNSLWSRWNRGAAVWEGRVYVGTGDCRLVAIDAAAGTKLWEAPVCDPAEGMGPGITGAPRVGDGRVYMGYAGSDTAVRGSLAAFDTATGEELWRFWTVPGDPADGFESEVIEMASRTWTGGWAQAGGGVVWDGIRYDPVTGLVIFGTASTLPLNVAMRGPGDNLFTNSVVAVDAATGAYRWHYQTVPEDAWDYDATMPKIVTDIPFQGSPRRVVLEAPKNGFLYVLDANTGRLLSADPIATVTWASSVDIETGRPVVNPEAQYFTDASGAPVRVWPNVWGSHNWQPMSYSPLTGLLYIPVADMPSTYVGGDLMGMGVDIEAMGYGPDEVVPPDAGRLLAWDPVARETRWRVDHPIPYNGGVLSTAGNLVFQGTATGEFRAYAADTGERLWSVETGSSIQAAPVSYRVGGEQYVLVAIGRAGGIASSAESRTAAPHARGPARVLAFKRGGDAPMPEPAPGVPVPEPPARLGTTEQVAAGAAHWSAYGCTGCHGAHAIGMGSRALGGGLPDLRYMPTSAHEDWEPVVLEGTRAAAGMPGFAAAGMSADDSRALQAYVLDRAWAAYEGSAAQ